MRPDSHTQSPNNCLRPFYVFGSFFFLVSVEMSLFRSIFVRLPFFSLSVWRVRRMVLHHLVTTGYIYISLCENSIKQYRRSTELLQILPPMPRPLTTWAFSATPFDDTAGKTLPSAPTAAGLRQGEHRHLHIARLKPLLSSPAITAEKSFRKDDTSVLPVTSDRRDPRDGCCSGCCCRACRAGGKAWELPRDN